MHDVCSNAYKDLPKTSLIASSMWSCEKDNANGVFIDALVLCFKT